MHLDEDLACLACYEGVRLTTFVAEVFHGRCGACGHDRLTDKDFTFYKRPAYDEAQILMMYPQKGSNLGSQF